MIHVMDEKQPSSPPSRRASAPTPLCSGADSKKVCFDEDVTLISVTARRDMSEEERATIWYTVSGMLPYLPCVMTVSHVFQLVCGFLPLLQFADQFQLFSAAPLVCTQQLNSHNKQDDDFAEIRSDMRRTARLIHRLPRSLLGSSSTRRRFSANDADDMEICARGLEHLASRQVLKRLQDELRTVKDAVLTLQSNPMAYVNNAPAGSTEDNAASNARLATDYSNVVRIAHERALRTALADAEEAMNYLRVST